MCCFCWSATLCPYLHGQTQFFLPKLRKHRTWSSPAIRRQIKCILYEIHRCTHVQLMSIRLLSLLSINIWLHTSPTMLISIAYHPALHLILATLKIHTQSCKVAFSWGFCCVCELLLFSDLVMASQRPPVLFMVTCSITCQFACNPTLTFGVTNRTVASKHA